MRDFRVWIIEIENVVNEIHIVEEYYFKEDQEVFIKKVKENFKFLQESDIFQYKAIKFDSINISDIVKMISISEWNKSNKIGIMQ